MIAIIKKLPVEITDYLLCEDKPEILKYITERKLRQLTMTIFDNEKIKRFDEIVRCARSS